MFEQHHLHEPGDAGHSMREDCLGVREFCAGELFLCWELSPAERVPCLSAGGFPNKEATGRAVMGREGAGA